VTVPVAPCRQPRAAVVGALPGNWRKTLWVGACGCCTLGAACPALEESLALAPAAGYPPPPPQKKGGEKRLPVSKCGHLVLGLCRVCALLQLLVVLAAVWGEWVVTDLRAQLLVVIFASVSQRFFRGPTPLANGPTCSCFRLIGRAFCRLVGLVLQRGDETER